MKIIRIPFDDLDMIDLRTASPDASDPTVTPGQNDGGDKEPAAYLPAPVFHLEQVALPGHGYSFPEASMTFDVPADDMPRVAAWFSGNYQGVSRPASATLSKNLSTALYSLLDDFYEEVATASLFASPFRLSWRWRLMDGSVYQPESARLIVPASVAPTLVIDDYALGDKYLTTDVIIRQMPSRINVTIPALGERKDLVAGIEFFATSPLLPYSQDGSVNGLRSAEIDGARARIWHYDAPSESANLLAASADEKFRLLGSIPVSQLSASSSSDFLPLPLDGTPLPDFPDQPGSGSGSSPETPPVFEPLIHAETPPLDLGNPENFKQVTALYLRGIFPRDSSDMELSLYGSIHRENWRLIARARGPYIRGLRGCRFRWLKVRVKVNLRPGDFLDALTFTIL